MSSGIIPTSLLEFARSVDIVSEETTDFIRDLVDRYMKSVGAAYYLVVIDGAQLPEGPGLGTFQSSGNYWSLDNKNINIRLRDNSWAPDNLMAFAYEAHKPLWIVDENKGGLIKRDDHESNLIDFWSSCRELPRFNDISGIEIQTSIVLPLSHAYRIFGIFDIQFREYIEPTDIAKDHFKALADAIAIIINLYQVRQAQLSDTKLVRTQLESIVKNAHDSPFVKPKLFFAYSDKADLEVIQIIRRVLDEFHHDIDVEDWRRNLDAGDLYEYLKRSVSLCRYAICYLSEPSPEGALSPYIDNPNVLIEAGIFYALSLEPTSGCRGWIPIREEESPETPFNIAPINTIKIQRLNQRGERGLNREYFENELKNRLRNLLND